MAKILTDIQERVLRQLSKTQIAKDFYFTGGTALSEYYLQHRYSEDLDFFSEVEFDPQFIPVLLEQQKRLLQFETYDIQQSFNRNVVFLRFPDQTMLKLEFTYYPFKQIETPTKIEDILVDSLLDILVNKIFTISQRPRGRDFYDVFCIMKSEKIKKSMEQLRLLAKEKFDWHIDPLQLGSKFKQVDLLLDDPILVKKIDQQQVQDYFYTEAKKLANEFMVK